MKRVNQMAAPAVQGESVAYAVFADNGNIRIWSADPIQAKTLIQEYGDQVQPLYTAPQPAEQQPATDVAALVEALNVVKAGLESDDPAIADTVWVPGAPETLLDHVCAALDAYRNQGGE